MRISDWSSDVCSSDLTLFLPCALLTTLPAGRLAPRRPQAAKRNEKPGTHRPETARRPTTATRRPRPASRDGRRRCRAAKRSEERRAGKKCVGRCWFWWAPYVKNKNTCNQYSEKQ